MKRGDHISSVGKANLPLAFVLFLSVIISLLSSTACSVLKASPAPDSGFLPYPKLLTEQTNRAPSHGYWVDNAVAYEKTRFMLGKVYVAPVDTTRVAAMYQASSGSEMTKTARIEEAQELARYFQEKIRLELRNRKESKIQAADSPGPDVLALKLALVEVVPTNPGVNIVGTAAGVLLPGGGIIRTLGEGSIAMEGLVEESGDTLKVREQYKDREGQKVSFFSFKDYQRYAHLRQALDEWAMEISGLLNTTHDIKIEGANLISINPL